VDVIVRATAQVVSREGPDRVTTNRVAARVGVSVGSLYQYFPSNALAAAVALDVAGALIHGVALRAPERLADEEFAVEVTDLLVRYLAK
jgi:AcrR family transcriptional regulator